MPKTDVTDVITVKAPLQEMFTGYLSWNKKHTSPGKQREKSPAENLVVKMPSIDLYSPTGTSIYHGTDSEKNAIFLRALTPQYFKEAKLATSEIRPILTDFISIFPELRQFETSLVNSKKYTIFAMTYPNKPMSAAQNAAMENLKRRARDLNITVVEVQVLVGK